MRIILADHHHEPRWALKLLIEEQSGLELVGEAVDTQGLLRLAEEHAPDLVLVDGGLPGISIEVLIAQLHGFVPRPSVIVMSNEIESGRKFLQAGADVFVSKMDQSDWLVQCLNRYKKHDEPEGGYNPAFDVD